MINLNTSNIPGLPRLLVILLGALTLVSAANAGMTNAPAEDFMGVVRTLASLGDRSTGTMGNAAAAAFIKEQFVQLGFDEVGSHQFLVPVRRPGQSTFEWPDRGIVRSIHPILSNAITPETISAQGLEGALIYAGSGDLKSFNRKGVAGAIVLMEIDSGRNWLNAASLGAKALIYLDRGGTPRAVFEEKIELTPIQFPRFWLPVAEARQLFGAFETASEGRVASHVRLTSEVKWQELLAENIYCLIPGNDASLREELIIIEAFYDSTAMVFGHSPGADEACGLATLMMLARQFKHNPPARSVLLVATNGHAQELAGMRELIWSIRARSKDQRQTQKVLKKVIRKNRELLGVLRNLSLDDFGDDPGIAKSDRAKDRLLQEALVDGIKTEVDRISRRLMRLRLEEADAGSQDVIQRLAAQRMLLRRLGWRSSYTGLSREERRALRELIPLAQAHHEAILRDAQKQLKVLQSARRFRSVVKGGDLAAVVSLHLSSHGDGLGAFNQGWLYPLKPTINRVAAYSTLDEVLREGASRIERSLGGAPLFRDTLRPSQRRSWQSYFLDRPPLGGEVSALAGYLGVTLATVHDARAVWGTPADDPAQVNRDYAVQQSRLICGLIRFLSEAPRLNTEISPRNGFATVTGRANLLRHGELFADKPAAKTMILAYQGPGRYHAMVDSMGMFRIKGVADKKHVLHKVIIEGYRFNPVTGAVMWAIDKKQTGKAAYRVKMRRQSMETDLVMFACRETTLFNLLEPRSFRYMTKVQLIDGHREAPPQRYWYSRIDTRSSIIASVYLDPGSRLKMTLSDTVLRNKMVLTNASDQHPQGAGYLVDEWPAIHHTELKVARDMWALLAPRIANLESHGIFNERVRRLQQEGTSALHEAQTALKDRLYDRSAEAATRSWALASRVYDDVQQTQKDVLFGVLFYIALFVPFAFCMERLLFAYTNIHKRILAFFGILVLLIAVIYKVHPAFELAYSPMVVILAFLIMGLSLVVTLIIFFRFESEMSLLQSRSKHIKAGELGRWKAFVAAFFLGVSNLRRRRLRTALTCLTLIILTFTIMSFTSVKTMRHHARLLYQAGAPYQGIQLKNVNWQDLPPEALGVLSNVFEEKGAMAPRVWLEDEDRTRTTRIPVRYGGRVFEAQGMVGLSAAEVDVTGMDRILVSGRWFKEAERQVVLLSERMAIELGIDPTLSQRPVVALWGMPREVVGIFSGKQFLAHTDLDGEPLTPATFPNEASTEMTEVEIEALESGEDVRGFQSRYQHVAGDLTLIVPHRTLLAAGGHLKAVAMRSLEKISIRDMARHLVDRFGLTLFSGEPDGTYVYHASNAMRYSGVPNIVIPLIISVFIVLNTMIGSVYERKGEIGIYTSVGLAPSHVSFLFIAEALAFAVLSVVLGYLLAQTTASLFSGTALWAGITVNYSSLAGVAAMILVILVVLISVIYPSKVAAEIAIPDVNRSWRLPDPKENAIEITLPFLMKYSEQKSIGGYLFAHFEGHRDVSHGLFSTGDMYFTFECAIPFGNAARQPVPVGPLDCEQPCLRLHARVWLAPFDFGIMQEVDVQFCPSFEEPGLLEITVRLVRESGEANAWGRINKAFLNDLRKQLLVWRSLEKKDQDDYARMMGAAFPA